MRRTLLPCAFLLYPLMALAGDEKPLVADPLYARPQHLVEVEPGRRLNLYCVGAGKTTVIFESGLGGGTPAWAPIQSKIAENTRACSYDRAGINFSDPGNRPSSSANIADDLHRLLVAASIHPSYVLVGHSYGGMNVRLFADKYRKEVAAMVLVDPTHEDQSEGYRSLDPEKTSPEEWARQREPRFAFFQKCGAAASAGFVAGTETYRHASGKRARFMEQRSMRPI